MTLIRRSSNLFPTVPTFFDDFFMKDLLGWSTAQKPSGSYLPPVNILENETGFIVEMAVPGSKKENFKIELENDVLVISSETETKIGENNGDYLRREFTVGPFKRTFSLPENVVDGEKVEAQYTDGVLKVSLPKKEEAKPKPARTIAIG